MGPYLIAEPKHLNNRSLKARCFRPPTVRRKLGPFADTSARTENPPESASGALHTFPLAIKISEQAPAICGSGSPRRRGGYRRPFAL